MPKALKIPKVDKMPIMATAKPARKAKIATSMIWLEFWVKKSLSLCICSVFVSDITGSAVNISPMVSTTFQKLPDVPDQASEAPEHHIKEAA